jgi:hypothetical protein
MDLKAAYLLRSTIRTTMESLESAFTEIRNRVSVGVGIRDEGDYRIAIRIRTPQRIPVVESTIRQMLRSVVSPEDIDLRHTGPVFALPRGNSTERKALLTIGASVSHAETAGGTLGFFATSRLNGDKGIVSANHVIGKLDGAALDDPIVHPGGNRSNPTVARFARSVLLAGGGQKRVDASFAKLDTTNFDASLLPNGQRLQSVIADPSKSMRVRQFGSTTKTREGRITSIDNDKFEVLGYSAALPVVQFDDQIEVESAAILRAFARDGDSGALVCDHQNRPVGLLFALTVSGGRHGTGLCYVNPMRFVLDDLKVDLMV